MTTPALATYALITLVYKTRIEVEQVKIGAYDQTWTSILRGVEERYRGWSGAQTASVQSQTLRADGTVAVRSVKRCPLCDLLKVPGTRHKCDPRLAPVVGLVLLSRYQGARWDSTRGDEVDGPNWHDPSKSPPGWEHYSRTFAYTVTSVEEVPAEPAFEFDGYTYDATPAFTRVSYTISELPPTGTPPDAHDDDSYPDRYPETGDRRSHLDVWRSIARKLVTSPPRKD